MIEKLLDNTDICINNAFLWGQLINEIKKYRRNFTRSKSTQVYLNTYETLSIK